MKRIKSVLMIASIVALAVLAGTGCKNVCQKAADHYLKCWEEHCAANEDDERCEYALDNQMMQAMQEAESCPIEERAQALLEQSCEEVIEGEGL